MLASHELARITFSLGVNLLAYVGARDQRILFIFSAFTSSSDSSLFGNDVYIFPLSHMLHFFFGKKI
jgi:hypothetical protein